MNFDYFEKSLKIRDEVLDLVDVNDVEALLITRIADLNQDGVKDSEILDFVRQLNTQFLSILITEGQDHSRSLENVRKAREVLKALEDNLKSEALLNKLKRK